MYNSCVMLQDVTLRVCAVNDSGLLPHQTLIQYVKLNDYSQFYVFQDQLIMVAILNGLDSKCPWVLVDVHSLITFCVSLNVVLWFMMYLAYKHAHTDTSKKIILSTLTIWWWCHKDKETVSSCECVQCHTLYSWVSLIFYFQGQMEIFAA